MNQETYRGDGRIGRRRRQRLAITLVRLSAFLLTSSCAVAQTGKLSDEDRSKIETAVSRFMEGSKAPGISAAVVQNGEFVWSRGFGMADLENSVPATSQTLYRISNSHSRIAIGTSPIMTDFEMD